MTSLPLEGITVVSVEHAVAAPFATRQLADLGARVVKVERPGPGDFARGYDETVHGQSSYFVWLNRSKESLSLNLKDPAGREVLQQVLATADVLVHNLGPGAAERMGLSAKELGADFPRLIVCAITGFGSDGPWADRKAYDMLVQAESGLMSLTGTETEMAKVGISVADIAAGMYAYAGVLAGLIQRSITGRAQPIEVSLFEALAEWMGSPALYTDYGGESPRRVGAEHATIAPYGPFRTSDGAVVVVAVQNDREWQRFCEVVLDEGALAQDPRYSSNSARVAHRDDLRTLIAGRLGNLDRSTAAALLDRAGIANASLRTVRQFLDHPVLAGRGRWRQVETPGGPVRALLPPTTFAGSEARMDPVPAVGEHTDQILTDLGRTAKDIALLRATGVI